MKYFFTLMALCVAVHAAPIGFTQNDSLNYGLVGWWTMNEGSGTNAYDYSGGANTGTNTTTTLNWTNGFIGSAFVSSTTAINLGNKFNLYNGGNTFSAWFKTASATDSVGGIFGKTLAASQLGRWSLLRDTSQKIGFLLQTNDTSAITLYVSITSYTNNVWHNLSATVSTNANPSVLLYVDGVSVAATNVGVSLVGNTLSTYIGCYPNGSQIPASFFNGQIDDVRIYNRALSADEIKQLYGGGYGHQ